MSRILLLQTPRYLGPYSVKDRSVGLGFRADVSLDLTFSEESIGMERIAQEIRKPWL